jgi:hypothetical protein
MDRTEPRLATLLDLVHAALMAADHAALGALESDLLQELDQPGFALTEAELRLVRHRAARNAVCLLAAQRGLKAARRRLGDIRDAASGLVTYDREGRRAGSAEPLTMAKRL